MKILTDIIAYGSVVLRSSLVTMDIGRTEIATANAKIGTVFWYVSCDIYVTELQMINGQTPIASMHRITWLSRRTSYHSFGFALSRVRFGRYKFELSQRWKKWSDSMSNIHNKTLTLYSASCPNYVVVVGHSELILRLIWYNDYMYIGWVKKASLYMNCNFYFPLIIHFSVHVL